MPSFDIVSQVSPMEIENAVKHSPTNHHFNEQIRQRAPGAQTVVLSAAMKPAEIERVFAAAQALFGELKPQGAPPVRVPVHYPFGH